MTAPFSRLKATLFQALKGAGALILKNDRLVKRVSFKQSPINLVTNVDKACDALIQKTILRAFPDHELLTEESQPRTTGSPYRWIVDPLDGTTNYAHHFPQVGVSIGLEYQGRVVLGGVFDPYRDELFWAAQNRGAFLISKGRSERLHISSAKTLQQSLLLTGFPYDRNVHGEFYLKFVGAFLKKIQGIRRAGAAALDLCWVAAGRVDGYWEWRLKPWDAAAGSLIVAEAGGRVTDFKGGRYNLYGEQTLATNGKVHREMLGIFKQVMRQFGARPACRQAGPTS